MKIVRVYDPEPGLGSFKCQYVGGEVQELEEWLRQSVAVNPPGRFSQCVSLQVEAPLTVTRGPEAGSATIAGQNHAQVDCLFNELSKFIGTGQAI